MSTESESTYLQQLTQNRLALKGFAVLQECRYTTRLFALIKKHIFETVVEFMEAGQDIDYCSTLKLELTLLFRKYEREIFALISMVKLGLPRQYSRNFVWGFLWPEVCQVINLTQSLNQPDLLYNHVCFFEKWLIATFDPSLEPLIGPILEKLGWTRLDYLNFFEQQLPIPFEKYKNRISAFISLLKKENPAKYFKNLVENFILPEFRDHPVLGTEKQMFKEIRDIVRMLRLYLPRVVDPMYQVKQVTPTPKPEEPISEPQTKISHIKEKIGKWWKILGERKYEETYIP